MSYHCVIFDLDGTLLDTLQDITDAANQVLQEFGFPARSRDEIRRFVGEGADCLFERALPADHRDKAQVDQAVKAFRSAYGKAWDVATRPYPGVSEALDALRQRKVPMAVLSNKADEFTRQCVEHFFSQELFAMVMGMREDTPRKPDPAGAWEIAAELDVRPADCLYVGDTEVDVETARAAGMTFVGAVWGFRSRSDLEEAGGQNLIEHPRELVSGRFEFPRAGRP